jgi:hypothetical protein
MTQSSVSPLIRSLANKSNTLGDLYESFISELSRSPFEIASDVYAYTSDQPNEAVLCEYVLYKLFPDGLVWNPFLIHFVGLYNTLVGRKISGPLVNALAMILAEEKDALHSSKIVNLRSKTIPIPKLRLYLQQQWISSSEIDSAMSWLDADVAPRQLQQLHDNDDDDDDDIQSNQIDILVDQMVHHNRIQIPLPFNWVTDQALRRVLTGPREQQMKAIQMIIRMKASNAIVDFVYTLLVEGVVSPDDVLLLVYEFVMYNLSEENVTERRVRLMSTFLISLHDNGVLQPSEDYRMLFSSFLPWIGTINEARQVYLL